MITNTRDVYRPTQGGEEISSTPRSSVIKRYSEIGMVENEVYHYVVRIYTVRVKLALFIPAKASHT